MFETMPTEHETTVKSGKYGPYQQTKREAQTRWVLNLGAEGVPQVVVDLTTIHSPEAKRFHTSLTWGTVETKPLHPADGTGTCSIYSWASDHASKGVYAVPVARYSVKALEAHHEIALAHVEQRWPHFAWVFEEAYEREGLGVVEA